MSMAWKVLTGLTISGVCLFFVAIYLVLTPPPGINSPADVFGFSTTQRTTPIASDLPALRRYTARDGAQLAYRFYDSVADTLLIFIHGASYHGAAYHELATVLSASGTAKVYLPNLRGHYMSGNRRGDIDYIGQLEDDIADLVSMARHHEQDGSVYVGGHSSGGGLAIRFAGGAHGHLASGYILLSPMIPMAASTKGGNAGGWASLLPTILAIITGMTSGRQRTTY